MTKCTLQKANNNTTDNVYSAVIMAEPLPKFTWQHGARWPLTFGPSQQLEPQACLYCIGSH